MKKTIVLNIIKVLIVFAISIIMCWHFATGYVAYDTTKMKTIGYEEYANTLFFNDGRVFSGALILLANKVNLDIDTLYIINYFMGLLISSIVVVYLAKTIINLSKSEISSKKKIFLYFVSFITIFNFMYLDNMTFIEFPIMALSIFLYILSVKKLIVDNKKIESFLYCLIAIFCYQATINILFTMAFFLAIVKEGKITKELIKKIFAIILIAIVAVTINFAYIKIRTENNRIENNVYESISKRIEELSSIFINNTYVLPKYTYIITILVTLILIYSLTFVNTKKHKYLFMNSVLIILASIISCLPVALIFDFADIYICGRLFTSIGASFGLLILYVFYNDDIEHQKSIIKTIIVVLTILYGIIQTISIYDITRQYKISNKIDRTYCEKIKLCIENYEKNNNVKITKYACRYVLPIKSLEKNFPEYENLKIKKSHLARALPISDILKYYCDWKLERVFMEEEFYNEHFKDRNFEDICEEEFIFIGDTAYFCIY